MRTEKIKTLRASGKTSANSLAGSIAVEVGKNGKVEISYIGAAAGNTTMKAIAIARGKTTPQGFDLWAFPVFQKTQVESHPGEDRVGMKIIVENKGLPHLT